MFPIDLLVAAQALASSFLAYAVIAVATGRPGIHFSTAITARTREGDGDG